MVFLKLIDSIEKKQKLNLCAPDTQVWTADRDNYAFLQLALHTNMCEIRAYSSQ